MSEQTRSHVEPLDAQVAANLEIASVATLTTQLLKRGFRTRCMTSVNAVRPELKMVGVARTLRYVPAREDLATVEALASPDHPQRWLVEQIGPGEVLVIDAQGDQRAGTLGEILATRMMQRGCAGIVSDGPFRDLEGIRALDFPTFCTGSNANANVTSHHAADTDVPVGCGGVLVMPGDVIVGDSDGVVVIPWDLAAEVAAAAAEQEREEEYIHSRIREGDSIVGVYPMNEATRAEYEVWRRGSGE